MNDEELKKLLSECGTNKLKILDQEVSEKGANFSGGEKQRLALVRAILKDPDVIILDEATANLDLESEREIEKLVLNRFLDKIIIKISHRTENVESWDIVELNGRDKNN